MSKKASIKLARQLEKVKKAIKDEIVLFANKYGSNYVLDMSDRQPYKSVTIGRCSYQIDCVRIDWWNDDWRISIDSHGLNYYCTESEQLIELLQAVEESFQQAA